MKYGGMAAIGSSTSSEGSNRLMKRVMGCVIFSSWMQITSAVPAVIFLGATIKYPETGLKYIKHEMQFKKL